MKVGEFLAAFMPEREQLEEDVVMLARKVADDVLSDLHLVALLPDEVLEQVRRGLMLHYVQTVELD